MLVVGKYFGYVRSLFSSSGSLPIIHSSSLLNSYCPSIALFRRHEHQSKSLISCSKLFYVYHLRHIDDWVVLKSNLCFKKHFTAIIAASESFGMFYTMFLGTHSAFTTSKAYRSPSVLFLASIYGTATYFIIFITSTDITITSFSLMINLIL